MLSMKQHSQKSSCRYCGVVILTVIVAFGVAIAFEKFIECSYFLKQFRDVIGPRCTRAVQSEAALDVFFGNAN